MLSLYSCLVIMNVAKVEVTMENKFVITIIIIIILLICRQYFFLVVFSVIIIFIVSCNKSLLLIMLAMLTPASILPLSKLSSSSFFFLSNVLTLATLGEDFTGQRGVRNLEVETTGCGGRGGGKSPAG